MPNEPLCCSDRFAATEIGPLIGFGSASRPFGLLVVMYSDQIRRSMRSGIDGVGFRSFPAGRPAETRRYRLSDICPPKCISQSEKIIYFSVDAPGLFIEGRSAINCNAVARSSSL